jgi:HAD superfamily hydrolase (TIGR01509 family)
MMNFCPQAVIFDMDGLLVDSEPVWALAEGNMLKARGKAWAAEIQHKLIGMRMGDTVAGMIREYGLTDTPEMIRQEVIDAMVALVPEMAHVRPGALELLALLQAEGIPCAIASGSPMPIIEAVVTSRGWSGYFVHHCSGDEVPNGKPSPDIYLETARRMGADPAHVLTLEDSVNGAKAAVAAGMICYAVPDLSHTTHAAFENITPYVFDSLHDVVATLQGCWT